MEPFSPALKICDEVSVPAKFSSVQVVKLGRVVVDLEGNASGLDNSKTTCIEGETIYINVESETTVEETVNQTTANRFIYDTYTWEKCRQSSLRLFQFLK